MGDISAVLLSILAPGGVDKYLLTSTDGIKVLKYTLTYTNDDKKILRQYEGTVIPSYKYYIFGKEKGITVHHHLFEICYTVQQM